MSIYDHNIAHIDRTSFNSITEAYIGKTPILEEIEKKFHSLRDGLTMTNCSSTKKEVLDINRLVEKQFGMDIFALKILPTEEIDAYNYSIGARYDITSYSDKVVGNLKTGYRFKKDNGLCIIVCMSYGMLADKRFSDAALTGCLLHEIGHGFGNCIDERTIPYNREQINQLRASIIKDCFMNAILSVFIATIPSVVEYLKGAITDLHNMDNSYLYKRESKNRKKKPGSGRVAAFFAGIKGKSKDKESMRQIITTRTNQDYIDSLNNAIDSTITDDYIEANRKSPNRLGEVVADKFAAIYGYGPELTELIVIYDTISDSREYKMARKIRPGHKDVNDNFEKALFSVNNYDPHPAAVQRMNTMLKTLRLEYEKEDIDPKVKEVLIYQIDQIQANLDDICDASKKLYRIDKAQAVYFNYLKDNLPTAVSEEIESEIDKELDKVLEKEEKHYKSKKH